MISIDSRFIVILAVASSSIAGAMLLASVAREHFRRARSLDFSNFISNPPRLVTVSGLGKIERGIPGISEIVIICNTIEEPTDELLAAVRHNLKRGCKYRFFVSKSNYVKKKRDYFDVFLSIARAAVSESELDGVDALVSLRPLPHDWQNKPPMIFYRSASGEGIRTVAYRGFRAGEGIDNLYRLVDPFLGHALLEILVTIAETTDPQGKIADIRPEEFIDNQRVLSLKTYMQKKAAK